VTAAPDVVAAVRPPAAVHLPGGGTVPLRTVTVRGDIPRALCRADVAAATTVLVEVPTAEQVESLLRLGVRVLLDARTPVTSSRIRSAMREVADHGCYVDQSLIALTLRGSAPMEPPLTRRQLQILALRAQGLRLGDIAEELFLSVTTVRDHYAAIRARLDVSSIAEAVDRAEQEGWL
jgi:DNA-binding NarL/FixJ family response regulator